MAETPDYTKDIEFGAIDQQPQLANVKEVEAVQGAIDEEAAHAQSWQELLGYLKTKDAWIGDYASVDPTFRISDAETAQDYKYLLLPPNPFKAEGKAPPYVGRVGQAGMQTDRKGASVSSGCTQSFLSSSLRFWDYSTVSSALTIGTSAEELTHKVSFSFGDAGGVDISRDHHHRRGQSPRRAPTVLRLGRAHLVCVWYCSVSMWSHRPGDVLRRVSGRSPGLAYTRPRIISVPVFCRSAGHVRDRMERCRAPADHLSSAFGVVNVALP